MEFLENLWNQYSNYIIQGLFFVFGFGIVFVIGRFIFSPLLDKVMKKRNLRKHIRTLVLKITNLVVLLVALAVAFGLAGLGNFLTSFATIAAAGTLAIGFATQEIIKNFVSGIFIFTEKPFQVGDWVEWDDYSGIVEDIGFRVTRIRTFNNELLTVPNSDLTDGVIKNPVAKDKLRVTFTFGIGYEDDINEARDLILKEADKNELIIDDPEPMVRTAELADSHIGLKTFFWIKNPSRSDSMEVQSQFIQSVKEKFDEAGIDIPYPKRDLSGTLEMKGSRGDPSVT